MQTESIKSISEVFQLRSPEKIERKRKPREKDEPFNELYSLYTSTTQKILRKKENWRRYRLWLMANRIPHTMANAEKFKKVKKGPYKFIEEYSIARFAYMTSHFKLNDLYYALSVARDRDNRNQSIGAWLFSYSPRAVKLSPGNTCIMSGTGV